jgi:hypothetical protein
MFATALTTFAMSTLVFRTMALRAGGLRLLSSRSAYKPKSGILKDVAGAGLHDDFAGRPATPVSFGEEFTVPAYSDTLPLENINEHELDKRIRFDEAPHEYFFDGKKVSTSVTAVVESYFEKFDAEEAITKMKRSGRWPRPEYMMKNGVVWTDAQIKAYWDGVGLFARNRGTWMHYNIERYLNNLVPSEDCQEMSMFYKFYDEVIVSEKVMPWRTEWRICDPEHDLAGSVDFVGKLPDGTYAIMDWKRSKNLANSLGNSYGRRGKAPLEHVEDTDASKYFLQLNIYRYILQKHYGIRVTKMILASFHPAENSYFQIHAPIWDGEVSTVLGHFTSSRGAHERSSDLNQAIQRSAAPPSSAVKPKKAAQKPKLTPIANPFL